MLVRITNHCTMGCSHCLVEASPNNQHMSAHIYLHTIQFIRRLRDPIIMISGGEPTDHPDILKFLRIANDNHLMTMVLSNGLFVENAELRDKILKLAYGVQITNDSRFYPKKIRKYDHSKIYYEDRIRLLTPVGRAKDMCVTLTKPDDINQRVSPMCFNLRSLIRSMSLRGALDALRQSGKMCTPSINIDGSISVGELAMCTKIGNVDDSINSITSKLLCMRCSTCGLINNLNPELRAAIGEP